MYLDFTNTLQRRCADDVLASLADTVAFTRATIRSVALLNHSQEARYLIAEFVEVREL